MRFLRACDKVVDAGIHMVITAHAKMRKFEQPDEMGAYDRWEMKLSRQTAPLLKEWCDMLLFCNYKTYVVTSESNSKKAQGGKRVMYTSHHPAWDAKSRIPLPEMMDLNYMDIAFAFESPEAKPAKAEQTQAVSGIKVPVKAENPSYERVRKMMADAGISEEEIQMLVASKGHFAKDVPVSDYGERFTEGWLIKYWDKIVEIIRAGREAHE